jgi:CBS-domain-containing membrane protein
MKDWIPLINKLVWPVIIGVSLLIFHKEMKSGGSIEIGGLFKLGEKATETEIKDLSLNNISIEGIGGAEGVVRKGSQSSLDRIQEELANSPEKIINTLLVTDDIEIYSVALLKEYVSTLSTLGLHYVVFQERSKFVGWMTSDLFVAQLPPEIKTVRYTELRAMKGIRKYYVEPGTSAKEVLEKMQELHIDSIPVVDENKRRWLFFANRGEILANLMTSILFSKEE